MRATTLEDRLRDLMLQGLSGDAAAHHQLLAALSGHLRAYFRRRLNRSLADAEDLVQETLLAIHLKRETYDPNQLLTAWAYAIARYKLIDWYRRHKARPTTPLEEADALFIEEDVESTTAGRDLALLMEELPEKQAVVIRCMKLEGLSAAETAMRTGQSVSAVKVGVHRGLKTLAARLRG